jgi:hypothetical protein
MPATRETSYDLLPYEDHAHPQTHPGRLATVATLLGLMPPPVLGQCLLTCYLSGPRPGRHSGAPGPQRSER